MTHTEATLMLHEPNTHTRAQLKKLLWAGVHLDNYEKVVDALIAGAMVDMRNDVGDTPFLWAINHHRSRIAVLLLTCGADITARPKYIKDSRKNTVYYARVRRNKPVLNAFAELDILAPAA